MKIFVLLGLIVSNVLSADKQNQEVEAFENRKIVFNSQASLEWFGETGDGHKPDDVLLDAVEAEVAKNGEFVATVRRPFRSRNELVSVEEIDGGRFLFFSSDSKSEASLDLRICCVVSALQIDRKRDELEFFWNEFQNGSILEKDLSVVCYQKIISELNAFYVMHWKPFLARNEIKEADKDVFDSLPKNEKEMEAWLKTDSGMLLSSYLGLPFLETLKKGKAEGASSIR